MAEPPTVELDDLYALDGLSGDANHDGYPDCLRARIVLEPKDEPDAATWAALFDLAARLGLETAGFSPPLVVAEPAEGQIALEVRQSGVDEPELVLTSGGVARVVLGDPQAIARLARAGQADRRPLDESPESELKPGELDLRRLFEPGGLPADRDGDGAPDGSRLCIVVPEGLPRPLGAALIDLCARLGIESGGIDLPVATTGVPPLGAIPLRLALDAAARGAELAAVDSDGSPALLLSGSPDHAAALVERLASDWPIVAGQRQEPAEALAWLRRSLAGWTAEGRAAALLAAFERRAPLPAGASLQILSGEAHEQRALAALARRRLGEDLPVASSAARLTIFAEEWSTDWEVERALDALRQRVLPELSTEQPLELTVLVSEPAPVRARLRDQLQRLLAQSGFAPERTSVVVLDAFKAGLSWLIEEILPRLARLGEIDRIVVRYRALEPTPGQPEPLDVRIRWLQELFPADELLAEALGLRLDRISFEERQGEREREGEGDGLYAVEAFAPSGDSLLTERFSPPTYQRPYLSRYPQEGSVHVVTGGIIARQSGRELREPLPTDLDLFWSYYQDEVLPRVVRFVLDSTAGRPQVEQQPFFDELRVELSLSATDEPFGVREEQRSAAEALHEDIYFNTLDLIETLGQEETGQRLGAPGAVVPIVHVRPGQAPSARITLRARPRSVAELTWDGGEEREPLGAIEDRLPADGTVEAIGLDGAPFLRLRLALDAEARRRLAALAELFPATEGEPRLIVDSGAGRQTLAWPATPDAALPAPAETPTPSGEIMSAERLGRQLARLAGEPEVRVHPALEWSYSGRPLPVVELTAPMSAAVWSSRKLSLFKPTLMIIARHHANEVASTTAALQLAERLITQLEWRWLLSRVNVALLPFANPDGAALHDLLQAEHPAWKHHPARYNATGFEFGADIGNPDSRYGEARVRDRLWRRWLPDIVVDNHGVPSHEWAQLYAGFSSPPRFGVSYWQAQALIYGIIRYQEEQPAHQQAAFALRDAVAEAVAADVELLEWNRRFRERYVTWGASRLPDRFPSQTYREMIWNFGPASGGRMRRGYAERFPALTVAAWVTEVGDETVRGPMLARTARAHLTANRATLDLLAAAATPPERRILSSADGCRTRITFARRRPILLGG